MTTAREEELQALRRPFAIGVACVLLAVVASGVVVARFGSNADRPAGIAERWLVAVGDTTRDGIGDDARHRIEELCAATCSADAVPGSVGEPAERAGEDGEAMFDSLRVGRAVVEGEGALVPVEVTPYDADSFDAYVTLRQESGDWHVEHLVRLDGDRAELNGVDCDPTCPGFPIERPERAPIGWFVGALLLGVLITVGCVAAVRAATPQGAPPVGRSTR